MANYRRQIGTFLQGTTGCTTCVSIPTLSTSAVTSITQTGGVSGGLNLNGNGGTITQKGVQYSSNSGFAFFNSTNNGSGTAGYTSTMTGLTAGTTYYVRAYATNSAGTGYGLTRTWQTSPAATNNVLITPCGGGTAVSVSYGSLVIGLGSIYQYTLNGSPTTYCGTTGAATNNVAVGVISDNTERACGDPACNE